MRQAVCVDVCDLGGILDSGSEEHVGGRWNFRKEWVKQDRNVLLS